MFEKGSTARLLDVDPDLGEDLRDEELASARRDIVVQTSGLDVGSWEPLKDLPEEDRHLGLLVVDGLIARDVVVADTACAELVGRGDVLRPWERFGEQAPMPYEVEWHVLEPTELAVLDRRATELACRYPPLVTAFVARTTARSHALAFSLAITCITGVKIRLLVLFWHLADRWGRVRPDGVFVPLRLTHEMLGKLVGARRPSVSTALGELADHGVIERRRGATCSTGTRRRSSGGCTIAARRPRATRPRPDLPRTARLRVVPESAVSAPGRCRAPGRGRPVPRAGRS